MPVKESSIQMSPPGSLSVGFLLEVSYTQNRVHKIVSVWLDGMIVTKCTHLCNQCRKTENYQPLQLSSPNAPMSKSISDFNAIDTILPIFIIYINRII